MHRLWGAGTAFAGEALLLPSRGSEKGLAAQPSTRRTLRRAPPLLRPTRCALHSWPRLHAARCVLGTAPAPCQAALRRHCWRVYKAVWTVGPAPAMHLLCWQHPSPVTIAARRVDAAPCQIPVPTMTPGAVQCNHHLAAGLPAGHPRRGGAHQHHRRAAGQALHRRVHGRAPRGPQVRLRPTHRAEE